MKIISRFDDNVLFDGNHDSIRLCVEDAASAKIALCNADLRDANLRDAYLCDADLRGANLRGADLRDAYLRNADLRDADLRDAYLSNWKIVPPAGSFVAWKKGGNGEIIKIKIPAWARRTSCLINRKCRAEFVVTLEITKEGKPVLECCGGYDKNTTYRVGKCTAPDKYDPDERVDCSHGIHFFLTREEAEEW